LMALDEDMKDKIFEIRTKDGKGSLTSKMGKTFLKGTKIYCYPTDKE
jgi:hypothetical protein